MTTSVTNQGYDAILVVSFGGPENNDDVIPFLKNVLRGKNVPKERMLEVAEHYYRFSGKSPINECNRALIAALKQELKDHGPDLPVYWGNRNWEPFLSDTLTQMHSAGVKRALAFVTSAYGSYSGCRQYREDIEHALEPLGEDAPVVDKIRAFFNHPGFIEPMAENVKAALNEFPAERRDHVEIIFTAHSIPTVMARTCDYVEQAKEASRLVAERVGRDSCPLVYQSRSGSPSMPWLEPDICDYLRDLAASGKTKDVVIVPIGFIADHMEVIFDLDTEAKAVCEEVGINMVRASTVGTHPKFVSMIRELILERTAEEQPRRALGTKGPSHDFCPTGCCPAPAVVMAHAARGRMPDAASPSTVQAR